MDDTTTTFVGRVATPVEGLTLPGGAFKATFRIASSQRRLDQASGEWRDGRSLFMTVVVWRNLAQHAAVSLKVGDPVMAHGRIFSREYEKDGRTQTFVEMEATALGPDLTWCTATVSRNARTSNGAASSSGGYPVQVEESTPSASGVATERWEASEGDDAEDEVDEIEMEMRGHEAAVGV